MLIVGDKEAEAAEVSVRRHREGDLGSMKVEDFLSRVGSEMPSGYTR
jgi:threonyl-tRNA synthetase